MIDRQHLLADLKPLLRAMEEDLRARCDEVAQIDAVLKAEYEQARAAGRTGVTYEEWRADLITQVAVAWVLSCVFVRFLEDNALIDPPRVSGPLHGAGGNAGLQRARDERETYFKTHAKQTDRDYLLAVFDDLGKLPGAKDVFGSHNPVNEYRDWLSGDAAQTLIEFFQKIDADGTGELVHDFTDDAWDTRFLGDLYQDLSEAARKKYALLQTPIFVEEFILERTLEPAINEFGLKGLKMIDPACGSGHFVLGSFARILNHWRKAEPGTSQRELVNRALAGVHGVDLNPYAVAIARFRLLLAAMRECQITRLKEAPAFAFNLACGDSLLHGAPGADQQVLGFHELAHHYQGEDIDELRRILKPGQYQVVVANPPYITVKDKALNQAYRERYSDVCHMKYSLVAPFIQRIVGLTCDGGFTGQITANSFMKREFGRKLIESFLPTVDLTHVINTSGAFIPGHTTPTVILLIRGRRPLAPTVRAVLSTKGEPGTPEDPAKGIVWSAILAQVDVPGSKSDFLSVLDMLRDQLAHHPWSIGGGGAAELKAMLDERAQATLDRWVDCAGFSAVLGEDEAFCRPRGSVHNRHLPKRFVRPVVEGELVRDWSLYWQNEALFPYDQDIQLVNDPSVLQHLWPMRTLLYARSDFSRRSYRECGRPYWEYHQIPVERNKSNLLIAFGSVTTHNHFVLDRGGKVFKQSAPIITLKPEVSEPEYVALLGLLNSSLGCFWMKQVFNCKGLGGQGGGIKPEEWHRAFEFDSTKLRAMPVPPSMERCLSLSSMMTELAAECDAIVAIDSVRTSAEVLGQLAFSQQRHARLYRRMTALQEELDWLVYDLFGLAQYEPVPQDALLQGLHPQDRPVEVRHRERMSAGETSIFYEVHVARGAEGPGEMDIAMRDVIDRRMAILRESPELQLIETINHKRRWQVPAWERLLDDKLRGWLLVRLEGYFDLDGRMNDAKDVTARGDLHEPRLTNVAKVADLARADKDFMQVAEIFTGRMDFDVGALVGELVAAESVPSLPVLRYKPAALDKRAAWERTWDLQRLEDAIDALFEIERLKKPEVGKSELTLSQFVAALRVDEKVKPQIVREVTAAASYVAECVKQKLNLGSDVVAKPVTDAARRAKKTAVGDIPVPPKYTSADFLSGDFWRLRGKLDVPKERWVSFPHCEGEDGTLVIAWAGYDHLQLARAIAERYELAKEREGRKLVPLLAAIGQLIPWLKQWHNDPDMSFGGTRMGDYFAGYLAEEAKALGQSVEQVMAWQPPETGSRRRGRRRGEVTGGT